MANAYVIPFNFNPSDTFSFSALSFSYTVPAGKYAIVTYSMSCSASWYGRSESGQNNNISNGHNAQSGKIELVTGDVLTRTLSSPTGTSAADSAVTIVTAQLNLNSNAIAYISARATFGQFAGAGETHTISNEAAVHAIIQEYNVTT